MSKTILVTGATGRQGGAFISSILALPSASSFTLLALTRNISSASAQKLAEKGVKLVEGDLNNVPAVFTKAKEIANGPIWGIFVVLLSQGRGASPEIEETQGKALVDNALSNNVEYFVYSSVDRGGDEHSWQNETPIPHFASKHKVELHLREKAAGSGMAWTILRPTAFMENWNPGVFGKLLTTTWHLKLPTEKLQLISTRDIGRVASVCFQSPDAYNGQAIGLAGAEITFAEAQAIVKEKTGLEHGMPETFQLLAKGLLWAIADVQIMFTWFAEEGYAADIAKVKNIYPELLDWGAWLEAESGFVSRS